MSEPLQFSLFDTPTEAEPAPATPLDPATYDQIPLRAEVPIPAGTYRGPRDPCSALSAVSTLWLSSYPYPCGGQPWQSCGQTDDYW